MNEQPDPNAPNPDDGTDSPQGSDPKSRPVRDTSVSESTRELRDTSRRRRDAEEKLQQHLLEAKEHVPHDYDHESHKHEQERHEAEGKDGAERQETQPQDSQPQEPQPQDSQPQEKDSKGDAG